jgi:hypothetical protein
MKVILTTIALLTLTIPAAARERVEHFTPGEFRGTLSWDNISAMETGVLKFGGSAGIHIATGIEVGCEQQFIIPGDTGTESRSWGFIRFVHKNLAFEASLFTQWVFFPTSESERQVEFDWRVVLYF